MNKNYLLILFFSIFCFAKEEVFIEEYTYNASELESKQEARQQAKTQAINKTLEKIAIYVKNEVSDQLKDVGGEFSEIIELYTQSITAGQVRTETIEESWNGNEFYIKLKIFADPEQIKEDLRKSAESFSKTGQIHAKERLAIVAFSNSNLSDSEINMFITELENELVSYNQYEVIGYQQAIERLKEANSDDISCLTTKCALDLGIDLQVDVVLQPTVNFYPNTNKYYLALQIISIVDNGKIKASVTEKSLVFPDFLDFLSSINTHILKLVVEDTGKQFNPNQSSSRVNSEVSGGIQINTTPKGATIILDGEERGKSPLILTDIAPGMHTIVLILENYNNLTKNIVVKPGMLETVDEIISKKMGDLYIKSNPSGANVYLNGISKGKTPISLKYLEIGDYLLKVEYDDYEEYNEQILVEFNYDKTINIDLDALPSKARFFSTPTDAQVYLDDKYIGNTISNGLFYEVKPGNYTVTMKKKGYYDTYDNFISDPGGNNNIDLILRKMPKGVSANDNVGFLSVDLWPKNSEVFINNESNKTPLSYKELYKGRYKINFISEGFKTKTRYVKILPKKHKKLDVKLNKIDHSSSKMRSYIFPGLGHFNAEKKFKGTIFMISSLASLFLISDSYLEFQDNEEIFDAAYQEYITAQTNIDEFAEIYKDAYDAKEESMNKVLGSTVIYGGIWLWNVFDMRKIIKSHEKIYIDLKTDKFKVGFDF